ncbi:ATP synthase F0 subunit 8 [uncultured Pantoea sp.]|uniref:ATP synthase F0 subunit 8 n=1 Tax=uncultured Pantoea sp. TaxID=218084 RepID=UPI0025E0A1A9|nr:ATP synthase F0 subunit 8 [uncultured Pantoea sp.]
MMLSTWIDVTLIFSAIMLSTCNYNNPVQMTHQHLNLDYEPSDIFKFPDACDVVIVKSVDEIYVENIAQVFDCKDSALHERREIKRIKAVKEILRGALLTTLAMVLTALVLVLTVIIFG